MDVSTVVAIAVPTVGVIVWLVRQEGRINGHDVQINGIEDDVRYIRDRIDRAINNGNHR